jgi:hypothetical protein
MRMWSEPLHRPEGTGTGQEGRSWVLIASRRMV